MKPKPIKYNHGYRVNFEYRGKRHRARFRADDGDPRRAAEKYIESVFDNRTQPPLDTIIEEFIKWSTLTRAPGTVKRDISKLRRFSKWYGGSITAITERTIQDYQSHFFTRKDRPQTWNSYWQTLATFLLWAEERGDIQRAIPCKKFRIKLQQKLPDRILSGEELERIFAHFDKPIESTFFRLLAYTGMRVGEAVALKWPNVDLKKGVIRVVFTKGKTVRSIPIHPTLKPYLEALPKGEYVFERDGGKYLVESNWWLRLRLAAADLGIPPVRVHDLRHTFAANLAMQGVPIPTIAELLGHSSTETTRKYIHFYPQHLVEAINGLPY